MSKENRKKQKKQYMLFSKPIVLMEEGEIAYIMPDRVVIAYSLEPIEYKFYIATNATSFNIPYDGYTIKIIKKEGQYYVDDSVYYNSPTIFSGLPLSSLDLQYFFIAQKINHKYFVGKIYSERMSVLRALDYAIQICSEAFVSGVLSEEMQDNLDYYFGFIDMKKDSWLKRTNNKKLIEYYHENFTKNIVAIQHYYAKENIVEVSDYLPWDITLTVILTDLENGVIDKIINQVENNPETIHEFDQKILQVLIDKFKYQENYSILAKLKQEGIVIPD